MSETKENILMCIIAAALFILILREIPTAIDKEYEYQQEFIKQHRAEIAR